MIYERRLSKKIRSWGMNNDFFCFMEDDSEDDIFELYCLMTDDERPEIVHLHKFILPEFVKDLL